MEGKRVIGSHWTVTIDELECFIGLCYLRGVLGMKNMPWHSLWSEKWGLQFFRNAMSRKRFEEIMRVLRFDVKSERQERLRSDKFALISEVWEEFVENCKRCYIPGENLCIDEQLFPTKARCRFTQFMANKPDKFGIKFWLLTDADSKYLINCFPYLGKDESRPEKVSLGHHVVSKLLQRLHGKGYNVTMDNFFMSLQLCNDLMKKSISCVGTVRQNKPELPPLDSLRSHGTPVHATQTPSYKKNFFDGCSRQNF